MFNLTPREKLIKARVQLNKTHPFFGRITMTLKFIEEKKIPTMAVNNYGVCYYNPSWVDQLKPEELKGVLCHEVMHCALSHLDRVGKKNGKVWNVATDLVINWMVKKNGLALPQMVLGGSDNYDLHLPNGQVYRIKDIDKRAADSIYEEIKDKFPNKSGSGQGGSGDGVPQGHDEHIYGDSNDELSKEAKEASKDMTHRNSDYWKNKLVESAMAGKMQGHAPSGMERIIDNILNPKMSWKQLLHKFVRNKIPFDFTWRRPSKKYYSSGWYMPRTKKEGMNVVLLVDTSGSMSKKDLEEVFGEVSGMCRQIRGMSMDIILHTTDVYYHERMNNPTDTDLKRILTHLKSGGTSHKPAFKFIEDNINDADVIISFTDGYSDFPPNAKLPTFFCIQKRGLRKEEAKETIPFGKIVKME